MCREPTLTQAAGSGKGASWPAGSRDSQAGPGNPGRDTEEMTEASQPHLTISCCAYACVSLWLRKSPWCSCYPTPSLMKLPLSCLQLGGPHGSCHLFHVTAPPALRGRHLSQSLPEIYGKCSEWGRHSFWAEGESLEAAGGHGPTSWSKGSTTFW